MTGKMERDEKQFATQTREQFTEVFNKEETPLTEEELRERILKFLGTKVVGTLATSWNDEPRSTPVRYRNDGFTIYIMTEGGGKLHNIVRNPRVSFSVYGNYSGFRSVRGLQIWGQAAVIDTDDETAYQTAFDIINLKERKDLEQLGAEKTKPGMPIIRITPGRVRYLSVPEGILNREINLDIHRPTSPETVAQNRER